MLAVSRACDGNNLALEDSPGQHHSWRSAILLLRATCEGAAGSSTPVNIYELLRVWVSRLGSNLRTAAPLSI